MLKLSIRGRGIPTLEEAAEALGSQAKAERGYRRALNESGRDTTPPTYRALAEQTGLKVMVARRALRARKATRGRLEFALRGTGGDIGLKHFGARETRLGVSAAPFGQRDVYEGTFIKGGFFPKRKVLRFGGHVFTPYGKGWGRPFVKTKSGVVIPNEMVKGVTAETFERVGLSKLEEKVNRHIRLITKGVLS